MVSSSFGNMNSQIRVNGVAPIVVDEVESHLRFNVIDLDNKDDNDRIPLRKMLYRFKIFCIVPLSNLTPISNTGPRLELRDEEFQMDETHPNPSPVEEIISEEKKNIDWTNEESVKEVDDERAKVKSDNEGVGYLFRSLSKLSYKEVDQIILKYNIPNQYLCRARQVGEYMNDQ